MAECKYKPEYASEIVRLGSEGKTKTQMAAAFNVSYGVFLGWTKNPKYPEFKEAFALACTLSQAYMEDLGMKGMKGLLPKFTPAPWIFSMKARYPKDYGDVDTTKIEFGKDVKSMTDQEIDDTIKALVARKAANNDNLNTENSSQGN